MVLQSSSRMVKVIRQAISQETDNGAKMWYTPAVVHSGGGAYEISAYVSGDTELFPYIRTMAGSYLSTGDYVIVGVSDDGDAWVDQILPFMEYAKMAIDFNTGRIYLGDGTAPPTNAGAYGQTIRSGGPSGSAYWG